LRLSKTRKNGRICISKEKTADLEQKQKIAAATADKIANFTSQRGELANEAVDGKKAADEIKAGLAKFNARSDADLIKEHSFLGSGADAAYRTYGAYFSMEIGGKYMGSTVRNLKEAREFINKQAKLEIDKEKRAAARAKGKLETIDNTLARYGINSPDNTAAIERIRKRYSDEASGLQAEIDRIKADRTKIIVEMAAQIKREARPGKTVEQASADNTRDVTGNLVDFESVKEGIKAEMKARGMEKAFVIANGKIWMNMSFRGRR